MKPQITTFIFDCFGVICDPVLFHWYQKNCVSRGFTDENLSSVVEKFDLGEISENDMYEYFSKYPGITASKEKIQDEIDSYLKINEPFVDAIKNLKRQGFKTVLLTDANAGFFTRKVYTDYPYFKDLFDEIIISSDIKMTKANPDAFLYALSKIKSTPEEALFIDDRKVNVDSAQALGINGFVYTDYDSYKKYIETLGIIL
jgi:HAD superfamily hydrolase (TIGR01509 family)